MARVSGILGIASDGPSPSAGSAALTLLTSIAWNCRSGKVRTVSSSFGKMAAVSMSVHLEAVILEHRSGAVYVSAAQPAGTHQHKRHQSRFRQPAPATPPRCQNRQNEPASDDRPAATARGLIGSR